jgi:hypothetical protein
MARRMFSTAIVNSDPFLDMPASTQVLYFHLGMGADDEGFVYPKQIMRSIGAAQDDLKILISKKFVLPFESGVIVIKHWNVNNSIRYDRKLRTTHTSEKALLNLDSGGVYSVVDNQHAASRVLKEVSNKVIKKENKEVFNVKDYKPKSLKSYEETNR